MALESWLPVDLDGTIDADATASLPVFAGLSGKHQR